MSILDKYVLGADGSPVVEPDLLTWARWHEENFQQCLVARTEIGDAAVSTVFLGTDRSIVVGGGTPQWRYGTRIQAQAGHDQICAAVRDGRDPSVGAE